MTTTTDPYPELAPEPPPLADLGRPTFQIWVDGERFASTQIPARAKALHDAMTTGAAKLRYGYRTVEFRVVDDRRATERDDVG